MTLNWCNRRDGGDSSQPIYGMRASLHGVISSVKEAPVSTGNTRKETGLRSLGLACPGSSATCCRVVHYICVSLFLNFLILKWNVSELPHTVKVCGFH